MNTEAPARGLTAEQLKMLLTPLNPNRVKAHKGNAHLEAWDVRRWLTRIFGFGGWQDEILSCECIHSVTSPIGNDPSPLKHRCTAVYRVTLRLTVKDRAGNVIGHWDDGATGEGVNQVSVGDAHDLAMKAALSQALKRCAVNLGDQFGLSLYNDGDARGVVVRTLGHAELAAEAPDPSQDAPVVGGELEEQCEAPAEQASQVHRSRGAEPTADAWTGGEGTTQAPAVRPASKPQVQKVNILIAQKRGNLPRPARLATVAEMVGRPLASANDLTAAEAHRLIEKLMAEPDHAATEPDDGQDFHLAPTVGPEQVCADLLAAMEAAPDMGALHLLGLRVADLKEHGVLHATHLERLEAAYMARQAAFQDAAAERGGWSHRVLAEQGAGL